MVVWWSILVVFLSCILIVSFGIVFYLWCGSLVASKAYENIPRFKIYPIISYWQILRALYSHRQPRVALLQLMNALCKMFDKERIFFTWVGVRPLVFFFKAETVEVLLNNSNTITKSIEYEILNSWLGTGLLTSNGNKWRSHRKLLTPAFHFQILEAFMSSFNEQASILVKKLELEDAKEWIDIVPMMKMCTLDTICETAMGVHLNSQSGSGLEYANRVKEVDEAFIYRMLRPWLWLDPVFLYCSQLGRKYHKNVKHIHDFTRKVIKEKKEEMVKRNSTRNTNDQPEKQKRKVFLELLLEQHLKDESFTEENVRDQVNTFMFGGHDTTAMSLSWTLFELGRHPEIQEKVYQELDDIFGYDKEREITSDDLKEMKFLERVIKETLRLYPPASIFGRKLTENLKVKDFTLPPGCTCLVLATALHMDPEQFPKPDVFDPDRFLLENCSKRHPYAYVPFSAGPRNCIGQKFALMEKKTILAHILRKFKIVSLDPRDKIDILCGIISKNVQPIRLNFTLRENDGM